MKDKITVQWADLPPIPAVKGKSVQPGLAGPVAGAQGNFMMVAGGANFEDKMPWRGGTKSYHDEIFLLEKLSRGSYSWKQADEKLPFPMAYPACLTVSDGIISIGGENANGLVNNVFRFIIENGHVRTENLPSLPLPLTSPGAACAGNKIYVAGGLDSTGASNNFLILNLDTITAGWQQLPCLPVAMSHSVVAVQSDGTEECIYVIGGRNKTTDVHTFFSTIWKYTPSKERWSNDRDIMDRGKALALSAGTGIAFDHDWILLFGGDPGIYFNRSERLNIAIAAASDSLKLQLLAEKDTLLSHHPGFTNAILAYNTVSKTWTEVTEKQSPFPATTVAFYWDDLVIVPSGEIMPGVRTPEVLALKIK